MQTKIQNVLISYWFKKIDYNPKEKLDSLKDAIKTVIDTPLLYNDEGVDKLIGMPRIEGISSDKKSFFSMSLINASLRCEINGMMDNDEVIMLINNYSQLFYDVLKDVYDMDCVYTSIKVDITIENNKSINFLAEKFKLHNDNYEDLLLKRGLIKDNYYINYTLNSGREYNFNVQRNENSIEADLYDQTLITSLSEASLTKEYILAVVEVNDRYSYNKNKDYRTKKDEIRGMILEIKEILNNEKYFEI